MENRKIIVTINGKRKEFDVECEKGVVIDDCSFELKKKKVTKNTLYVTGKKLGDLNENYTEREEIATDVKLVALSRNILAYVEADGELYTYNGEKTGWIDSNVTQIEYQSDTLYYISKNTLCKLPYHHNRSTVVYSDVSMFSCGVNAVMFISKGGLYAFGNGNHGVLGDYVKKYHDVKAPICIAHNVRQVSVGREHTVFVTNDNDMFGLGEGRYGRLGDGNITTHVVLSPIFIKKNVNKVFAGRIQTLFTTTIDGLYGLGDAQHGQMNDQKDNDHNYLTPYYIQSSVVDANPGNSDATLFKINNDNLYVVGLTKYNQDLSGCSTDESTLVKHLMNEEGEKVGDFDISLRNIAFIVK